ncbi:unnamed protein product, partial [Ectocarpus sp. 8 AP-2014]
FLAVVGLYTLVIALHEAGHLVAALSQGIKGRVRHCWLGRRPFDSRPRRREFRLPGLLLHGIGINTRSTARWTQNNDEEFACAPPVSRQSLAKEPAAAASTIRRNLTAAAASKTTTQPRHTAVIDCNDTYINLAAAQGREWARAPSFFRSC